MTELHWEASFVLAILHKMLSTSSQMCLEKLESKSNICSPLFIYQSLFIFIPMLL